MMQQGNAFYGACPVRVCFCEMFNQKEQLELENLSCSHEANEHLFIIGAYCIQEYILMHDAVRLIQQAMRVL